MNTTFVLLIITVIGFKNHLEAIEWWWKSGKKKHYNFIKKMKCTSLTFVNMVMEMKLGVSV